jgi:hypothetical protein
MVRLFAEYRSATDPRTEVPPAKLLPDLYHRKPPYIYTDEQVLRLIEAARQLPSTVPLSGKYQQTSLGYWKHFSRIVSCGSAKRTRTPSLISR